MIQLHFHFSNFIILRICEILEKKINFYYLIPSYLIILKNSHYLPFLKKYTVEFFVVDDNIHP